VIEGVHTTTDFLGEIVRDREFIDGEIDTAFLERFALRRTPADDA
jgi:biotin carboxylase